MENMSAPINSENERPIYDDTEENGKPLKVIKDDFHLMENGKEHHTDKFEFVKTEASPVLRRGQPFQFTLYFDRNFNETQDDIALTFKYGPEPSAKEETKHYLTVSKKEKDIKKNHWRLKLLKVKGHDVTLQVFIPATAQVGIWKCSVTSSLKDSASYASKSYDCPEEIYVLFNPWCKDDQVYVEQEDWKEEYVLNDTGSVWVSGIFGTPRKRDWIFGQFNDIVLPTTMQLLDKSELPYHERGDPVKMARAISAVVNSDDEDGLLEGNWDFSGDGYADGVDPSAWTGSIAIMNKYKENMNKENKNKGVKYGQCWVFSGCVVTVCRALGIACRSVTNYASGHDEDNSLTIDVYFNENGRINRDKSEVLWNFHVWNEVWMLRPDLPAGYGGWQAIDATSQEPSGGLFCCGPASVEAVRRGKVTLAYDTRFVYAEVNADIREYIVKNNGLDDEEEEEEEIILKEWDKTSIGRLIVTKAIGSREEETITRSYKDKEGSLEEKLSLMNAVSETEKARKIYSFPDKENEDVSFELVKDPQVVPAFGDSFEITVLAHNKSSEERTIEAVLSASSIHYTGPIAHRLKSDKTTLTLLPSKDEEIKLKVTTSDYLGKLVSHSLIEVFAVATVKETKQTWNEATSFPLIKPKLLIEINGDLKKDKKCDLILSFKNPLKLRLTECSYSIEGFGIEIPKTNKYRDIEPNESVKIIESLQPHLSDHSLIVATFTSKELTELRGSKVCKI